MANKDAAFGLKPIGKVGQNGDNNGLSEYSIACLLYTSPSPRDRQKSRMPSSA